MKPILRTGSLVLILGTLFLSCRPASAAAPPYRLEYQPDRRVRATLSIDAGYPHLHTHEWLIVAPKPTVLPWQRDTAVHIEVVEDGKRRRVGLMHGTYAIARIPAHGWHHPQVDVILEATLYSQRLVPVLEGAAPLPFKPLPEEKRRLDLRPTKGQDYDSPAFQAYLDRKHLRRHHGEEHFDFAYRAFKILSADLHYDSVDGNKKVSHVCRTHGSDCGGIANMFVATMRANGVPAMNVPGRWAMTGDEDHGQFHVKSAFYDPYLGWVKVDPNGGVAQHKRDGKIGNFANFGNGRGNFVTFSTQHPGDINVPHFGKVSLGRLAQSVVIKARGPGSQEGAWRSSLWTVERPDR